MHYSLNEKCPKMFKAADLCGDKRIRPFTPYVVAFTDVLSYFNRTSVTHLFSRPCPSHMVSFGSKRWIAFLCLEVAQRSSLAMWSRALLPLAAVPVSIALQRKKALHGSTGLFQKW